MNGRTGIGLALLAVWLGGCTPAVVQKADAVAGTAGVLSGDMTAGKSLFAANCSQCHGATGREGGIGPSLRNEAARMPYAQTVSWIEEPKPPMPRLFPTPLSQTQVRDVAAYVQAL